MTDSDPGDILNAYAEKIREREEQRPRREQLARKGRVRNKYRLLEKWASAVDEYEGPGHATLVDEYRPSGSAPVEVQEIAGLIVWDTVNRAHHFRLSRDETAHFIESPDDPDDPIAIDPMLEPPSDTMVYVTVGPPAAVTNVLAALDITPRWNDACNDGSHEFTTVNEGSKYALNQCKECGNATHVLSWLGHAVPYDKPE